MCEHKYLKNTVTLELDTGKCIGCRMCTVVCPHAVFTIVDNKAVIDKKDSCMECGACAINCCTGAIKVDSGVGCAAAFITGALKGTEPNCDCSGGPDKSCC